MSPLEELKEYVRENIEVHRRMGYDIGVARNEARLGAIRELEKQNESLRDENAHLEGLNHTMRSCFPPTD